MAIAMAASIHLCMCVQHLLSLAKPFAISPSVRSFVIEIAWLYSLISLLAIASAIAILVMRLFRMRMVMVVGTKVNQPALAHFALSSVIYASNGAQQSQKDKMKWKLRKIWQTFWLSFHFAEAQSGETLLPILLAWSECQLPTEYLPSPWTSQVSPLGPWVLY